MNKCILALMLFLPYFGLKGQVTIGSQTPPADYTVLQIDGTEGGLRLPRIESKTDRDALETTFNEGASGLVIYYIPENTIQFWNGNRWTNMLSLKKLNESKNGIIGSNHFSLGGNIADNTEITQEGQHLYFDAETGTFSVGINIFTVDNSGVKIGDNSRDASLDVSTTEKGGMRIRKAGETPIPGYVLSSDDEGNGEWISPKRDLTEKNVILPAVNINSTIPKELTKITLDKGIWLIMARYVISSGTLTNASSSIENFGFHAFIRLQKEGASANEKKIEIGTLPERTITRSWGSSSTTKKAREYNIKAVPQLTYIINVTNDATTYVLLGDINVPNNGTVAINVIPHDSSMGKSYLTAIQLSKKAN